MRRLGLALALSLCALVTLGLASPDSRRVIYIRNLSTLSDQQVSSAVPSFQKALSRDFAPAWGTDARLVYLGRNPVPKGAWRIILTDNPSCWFCYGYHEWDGSVARAEVGVEEWQDTLSHELWEMLVDPYGIFAAVSGGQVYALEAADPVDADGYSYFVDGVKIANFPLPAWYIKDSRGPWDFTRHCSHALEVLAGGYQLVYRDGELTEL